MKNSITLILIFLIIISFGILSVDDTKLEKSLIPINIIELRVPEPSGLYFDLKSNSLWTVSDENSTVYNIDIEGNFLHSFEVNGQDLEGITMVDDSTIVTILERERVVVFLNTNGDELKRFSINLKGKPNKGLEGITFNTINMRLYIISEKEPGILLEVDTTGTEMGRIELDYASDYSGLDYVKSKDELWIISDESESILKCSNDGLLLEKFKINIEQVEGIAIDEENCLLYLISDPLEKLYIYSLP